MKFFYAVVAMLCFTHSVNCHKTTNVSVGIDKWIKIVGGLTKFTCVVLYPIDFGVSWIKVNKENITESVVLTNGNRVVINDTRFSLRQDIVTTNQFDASCYTLLILGIKNSDAGIYRCQVMLESNNTIFAETELIMLEKIPPTILNNMTKSLIVMEGRPIKLECYANGSPTPSVFWKREDNAMFSMGGSFNSGNILEIPAAKKEDSGVYNCLAQNGVGGIVRRNVKVTVEFSPVVTTTRSFHKEGLKYYMDLACRVESYPKSTIVWLYNGLQLSNNQYYTISNTSTLLQQITESKLTVNLTEKHLFGDYICRASNILGSAEVNVEHYENAKKFIPTSLWLTN